MEKLNKMTNKNFDSLLHKLDSGIATIYVHCNSFFISFKFWNAVSMVSINLFWTDDKIVQEQHLANDLKFE